MSSEPTCWQCQSGLDSIPFCPACRAIQPPPEDYFAIFGMRRTLALSPADLQPRFYELSRQLHPDRFTRRADRERQYSLDSTSLLNDAWRVLRDPIARAEYVLRQEGFDIGEQRGKDVPPELLEEVFELNMALEELRHGDPSARPQLEQARVSFEGMRAAIDGDLEGLFARYDQTQERAVLQQIRAALNRRRYIQNLLRDVNQALETASSTVSGSPTP